MPDHCRARVTFSGRVQGVSFRANARDTAKRKGVNGWVRNLPNGKVEMVAEGERPQVEDLIEWCTHEQPIARVEIPLIPCGPEVFAM